MDYKFKFNDALSRQSIDALQAAWSLVRQTGGGKSRIGQQIFSVTDHDTAVRVTNFSEAMADALYRTIEVLGYSNVELEVVPFVGANRKRTTF